MSNIKDLIYRAEKNSKLQGLKNQILHLKLNPNLNGVKTKLTIQHLQQEIDNLNIDNE